MTTPNHPQEAGQTPVDEMRDAFETHFSVHPNKRSVIEAGAYNDVRIEHLWTGWQAACSYQREQDALICEAIGTYPTTDPYSEGTRDMQRQCATAIRSGASHD